MRTLLGVNINWFAFFIIASIIYTVSGLSLYSYFAILITVHQLLVLFYSIGYIIPIRYLFGFLMSLQLLFGPALAYSMSGFQSMMVVSEEKYFGYAIPAILLFIIGLHISSRKLEGEFLDTIMIKRFVFSSKYFPFILIGVGFVSSYVSSLFSADLAFVFYLLGSLKFIGVFSLIIGARKLKIVPLIVVYTSVFASSLAGAMFHDLMIWLIFLGIIFAIKYKPNIIHKTILAIVFIFFAILIQSLKKDYRSATWEGGKETGLETFSNAYEETQSQGSILAYKNLSKQLVRINQGYIVTNIMKTVPAIVPYSEGEELKMILTAAILPRFLAPNKLTAGNQEIFKKYSGIPLRKGTSMALSSIGDGYVNYGVLGGCIFMFILGLMYSEVLKLFHKYSKNFPILLLFTPLVFYYPIRPDCELQTILGHLVKSCFLIFVIFLVWKKEFKLPVQRIWKKYSY